MLRLSDNPLLDSFAQRALTLAVYGGSDFGECLSTLDRIGSGGVDDWYREWLTTADRVTEAGDASAARGHAVSAREAYFRASTYYRTAYAPLFGYPVDPRLVATFERECAVFHAAAALSSPPIEVLDIPFEGGGLPAYFVKIDDSSQPRPTVIHTNGYDSNIQEMYFAHAPAAHRRGFNCLLFDGPGQGRNLIRDAVPLRPDWESVVRPVVDYALQRPEIDQSRMVLVGWSLGGFLAPRAAAFEHRIAALIADPGQWDLRDAVPDMDPTQVEHLEATLRSADADPLQRWRLIQRGLWVNGAPTLLDYFASMRAYEISSVAHRITCPTLLTAAEGDPLAANADKLYRALTAPKTLIRFTVAEGAGGHCESMARRLYHQRVFDWLDETLGRAVGAA